VANNYKLAYDSFQDLKGRGNAGKMLFELSYFVISAIPFCVGIWLSSLVLVALGLISPFRRLGWAISKRFLYPAPVFIAVLNCVTWGWLIASGVHGLIKFLQPSVAIKIIFGWGAGAYIAIPDFGLFAEQSLSAEARRRRVLIEVLSLISYIASSILLALELS
jgi:hypothetical protein